MARRKLRLNPPKLPSSSSHRSAFKRGARRAYDVFDFATGGAVFETPGVLELGESIPLVRQTLSPFGGAEGARQIRRRFNVPRNIIYSLTR